MDWKAYYKEHTATAEEAVKHIRSGERVVVGHACGEPSFLVDAMVSNAAAYRNVEIVHMVAMGRCAYCRPEYAGNFRNNAIFVGGGARRFHNLLFPRGAGPVPYYLEAGRGACDGDAAG